MKYKFTFAKGTASPAELSGTRSCILKVLQFLDETNAENWRMTSSFV